MPTTTLETPIATLLATSTVPLPYQRNVRLRSFLLERTDGNVVVYNSPGIDQASGAIRELGGATRLLVNHEHEGMFGRPDLALSVGVGAPDHAALARQMEVDETFDGRLMIGDDLQVVPTPGHTPGTTSYLWDSGEHRFLFTGDFLWIEEGEWKAVVLDPGLRDAYLESLDLVRQLDFDVLVPWGVTEDVPCFAETDAADTRRRVGAVIDRVRAGGSR